MSSDSNSVEDKTEDKVEESEEEDMSKRKKIKISNNVGETVDTDKNEDTKAEISEISEGTPENTDLTVNSEDSSTNNSDVVSNVDNSTNNFDNTSNESEQVESASSNVCNSTSSETECTNSNADAPKQSVDNDSTEAEHSDSNADAQKQSFDNDSTQAEQSESNSVTLKQSSDTDTTQTEQSDSKADAPKQSSDNVPTQTEQSDSKTDAPKQSSSNEKTEDEQSGSVTQDDNQASKSDPPVDKVGNESPDGSSADLVSGNKKITTKQADSDNKNEGSEASPNSLKNDQESLYELLNNPKDVQDDTSVNANGKTEISGASNGSTKQTDTAAVQEESASTEKLKNDEITCEELLGILQEKDKKIKKKVLIIDVRNEEEYCKSRMSFHDSLISIPAEKIQSNKVPGYYRYILLYDIEAEKKFTRRSHYDIIVLVDKNSELKTMDSDSKIAIFKHSLEEYDVHIDYKRIAVLKGGFEEWTNLYPDFVTKS